jgi:hypothetical protein
MESHTIDLRKYFFTEWVGLPWNNLPEEPAHFSSIAIARIS